MKHKIVTFFLLILFFSACAEKKNETKSDMAHKHHTEHHTDHNKSNIQMNKKKFEKLAEAFERKDRAEWQKPDLVISKMGDLSDKKVGDIGAGTGYFVFRIAKFAKFVVGIDADERFINFMKNRKEKEQVENFSTRLVGYDDPKLEDEEFDVLLTVNTYHHFNDRVDYLKKCKKGLKAGGVLHIVDFKKEETPMGPPLDHKLNPEEVKEELLKAGFETVSIDSTSFIYQYMVTAY